MLVNCAGIFPNSPVVEMDTAEWLQVFAVNLNGPFFLSRAIARHMIEQGIHGSIVNISSGAGSSARTGGSHYCGSKAAINMFTKVLAIELGPHQIRVNAVAPGLILDDVMSLPVPEGANEYVGTLLKGIPLGRTGTPEDIAHAVKFVCSDQASWLTGEVIGVNGGSQAGRTHLPPSSPGQTNLVSPPRTVSLRSDRACARSRWHRPEWTGEVWITVLRGETSQLKRSDGESWPIGPLSGPP